MALERWAEISPQDLFGSNPFYIWLTTIFSQIGHTHTDYSPTNHKHTWIEIPLNGYATLWVNTATKMCELRYRRTFSSASADTFYTWHSGLIPSDYRPSSQINGSFNQVGILYIDSTGEVGGKFANGWNSSRKCIGSAIWHYGDKL